MRMLNNYLAGVDLTDHETKSASGFTDSKKLNFSVIEVIASSEEDVMVGDKVKIPINAGNGDELEGKEVIIFHRRDIIRIL